MNHENMKITEVGWIPKDWEVKTLEELFNSYSTASFSRDQMNADNEVFCVHYGDIHTKYGHVVELGKDVTPMISTQQAGRFMRLNDGDIILADASEDYEGVGKAIVVLTKGRPSISGLHTILLRRKNENEFSTTFPTYMFAGRIVKQQIEQLSEGTKINSISYKKIKDVLAVYPKSPSEQRRIAQVLSDTDSLIASLSRTIEKKRLVKQGAMQQLLTGKTRLKGFSGEWVEKELGEVVYVLDNKRLPLNDSQRKHGIYPYCGANGIVDYIDDYIFDEELILMAEDGGNFGDYETRPIAYIMQGKYWVNNHAHVLKAREEYCQRFIYHSIAHKNITDLIIGGTRAKLNQAVLKGVGITMPPTFDEQFAIANILTTMDNEIASLEAELQKFKALKQGMMQKLLTGQIRLK